MDDDSPCACTFTEGGMLKTMCLAHGVVIEAQIEAAILAERSRCSKIVSRAARRWANGKKSIGDGTQPAEILAAIISTSTRGK